MSLHVGVCVCGRGSKGYRLSDSLTCGDGEEGRELEREGRGEEGGIGNGSCLLGENKHLETIPCYIANRVDRNEWESHEVHWSSGNVVYSCSSIPFPISKVILGRVLTFDSTESW